jgi:energy-coupling factor transporter ATP-binding protein EcfA2
MGNVQTAFVAYSSKDMSLSAVIIDGVRRANAVANQPVHYEPWVFNDIAGNPLISPILAKIDESPFVVADITYLNSNVVYEIGFAIGRGKRVFLVRHKNFSGDAALAQEIGIFDTLGYYTYDSAEDLRNRLTSHIEEQNLPFSTTLDRKAPVYLVDPPTSTQSSIMVTARIKKSGYRFRSFLPSEETRMAASDAIRQVSSSAGIVLIFQTPDVAKSEIHNVRAMFIAGLSHGMGKPTLLLASSAFSAPLDIRDAIKSYRFPEDIGERVADFCPLINDHLQQDDPVQFQSNTILQNVLIGDPTAENEMTTLSNYFLKTDQYERALRGEVNLIVGRKGSGKTALFIMLRDKIRSDKRNIVVDLKPEGYQLLKIKEDILSYLTDGARQHLITAFWEYLILLEVAYKILEKDKPIYKYNHEIHDLYIDLDASYRVENFSGEGDFSERLLMLSTRIGEQYAFLYGDTSNRKLTTQEVTELLYRHDIKQLKERLCKYLQKKESVWILFDNLDKGWSTQGIDVIDTISLRCLIDAGRKIEREMQKLGITFHCLAFVRNDVYEHLMQNSADYGKEMRATLDWSDPDILKEILRLRFVSGLDKDNSKASFDQIWPTICSSHVRGEESSSYIVARSLMRPRNVLKIFNHAKGFANNFSRSKIIEEDIEKGLRAYSQDLVIELDRELSDVHPGAKDLLYHFIDSPSVLEKENLFDILKSADVSEHELEEIVDFLLYYGVLGIINGDDKFFIFDVGYDIKPLKIRLSRGGEKIAYVINPAFGPALGIKEFQAETDSQRALL